MGTKVTAIVPRIEGIGFDTIAVVEATISDEAAEGKGLPLPDVLFGIFASAITDWVNETEEGKRLWEYSGGDINIGDIAAELPSKSLQPYFEKYGIVEGPIVDVTSSRDRSNWNFDTVLVNEGDLDDGEFD